MARTQRERDEEKRARKLAEMREQVEAGTLAIRQMTSEERERYGPRSPKSQPSRTTRRRAR